MYLEHFGLREPPFRITPHTEFFFAGGNRGATLEALIYAVTHDEGIVKVIGEVGSGKTMLCRMLLERLPPQVETVYLANPLMTRDEILYALADELDIAEPPARVHQLLRRLQQRLVELYGAGKQIVVLIDEAHAMPVETLEEIRLLSNLESSRHKLLQIVLFGQPELDEVLAKQDMRQLRERITHNFVLDPLHRGDVGSYVSFRLRAAGYRGPDPFTAAAIRLIAEASAGLTRRINIAADKALLAAFSQNLHQVDTAQAKAAILDAQFGPIAGPAGATNRRRRTIFAAVAGLALLGAATVAWVYLQDRDAPPPPLAATPQPAAAAGPLNTPTTPAAVASPTAEAAAAVPAAAALAPPPAARAASPALAASPAAGGTSSPAPTASAEPLSSPPVTAGAAVAAAAQAPTPPASHVIAAHLAAGAAWLAQADDDRYFIQLLRTRADSVREVESFIARSGLAGDELRVYRSTGNGQEWLGVIYGDYPSREAASAAIRKLPATARSSGPYPRAVKMLR